MFYVLLISFPEYKAYNAFIQFGYETQIWNRPVTKIAPHDRD